jgi:AcrR family transcriptional regulator
MLHYYFKTKEKLYQKIISETLGMVMPIFASAMASTGTFLERAEHLVDTYINTILEHPEVPLLIMTEISQKRESFIAEIKKQATIFPAVQSFIGQMMIEMKAGTIREIPPVHLVLNILSMSVFPFMAKPMISTIFGVSDEQFETLMKERKPIIMAFIKGGLQVD